MLEYSIIYPSQLLAIEIANGDLSKDVHQMAAAERLDQLVDELCLARKHSWKKRLFNHSKTVIGLYLYGGVGRGKTMLMDMFVNSLNQQSGGPKPWRLHFHDFMVLAHDKIHAARQAQHDDPIVAATEELLKFGEVICFDEMEVRDIADAMILSRLFSTLINRGMTVVTTSNLHADDLYRNGLHRDRVLPFIDLLKVRCEMFELGGGPDWRLHSLSSTPAWYKPLNVVNGKRLDIAFRQLCGDTSVTSQTVYVAGRNIFFEKVAGDICYASFFSLCDAPLAARDYLALAGHFAGLVLADIPQFTDTNEHMARRFIWLIDALYDRGRFLIASSETDIENLYKGYQWQFEFDRTASRLGEMVTRGQSRFT